MDTSNDQATSEFTCHTCNKNEAGHDEVYGIKVLYLITQCLHKLYLLVYKYVKMHTVYGMHVPHNVRNM